MRKLLLSSILGSRWGWSPTQNPPTVVSYITVVDAGTVGTALELAHSLQPFWRHSTCWILKSLDTFVIEITPIRLDKSEISLPAMAP
ncbi:hypothetical protein K440DRAFT_241596 [Wilcoxina mikolae CBS 423.85]|nr:hypothetical protein K440DRAFT_241596 [Wilcoxina mikolae CBS 423.85]